MRLRIVERFEIDLPAAFGSGKVFGVAAGLATYKEGDLLQLAFGLGGPERLARLGIGRSRDVFDRSLGHHNRGRLARGMGGVV